MVVLAGILGIVDKYDWAFVALGVGFLFNFLMGMGADVSNQNDKDDSFSIKKAAEGVKLLMFYAVTIFCVYGMTYKDQNISETMIKWLTYIVDYFYLTNIFRNAKKIFPENRGIEFIYMFLSTEVFYKLKNVLGFKNINSKEDEQEDRDSAPKN